MNLSPFFPSAFCILLVVSGLAAPIAAVTPAVLGAGEVVEASKLISFLPKPATGWTSEPSEGSTTDSVGFRLTSVGCNYAKGEGETVPTAVVNIIDCSNQQFLDATTAGWRFSQETAEGYTKTIKVDEHPGFETFDKASKTGSIWVMVAKRFFLHIDLTNQEPAELQKWVRNVDLKKLSLLK